MSFEKDIPNYKNIEDEELYFNDLPSGIWNATQGLIRTAANGNFSILKDIINSIAEKTGSALTTAWSWNDLENEIPYYVGVLHRRTEAKGIPFFMDTLEMIYRKGELSSQELNEWLENNQLGYRCESNILGFYWCSCKDSELDDSSEVIENTEKSENEKIKNNRSTITTKDEKITMNNKVFIVHGHDDLAKETVARSLEKMGFEAIILHEQPDEGKTIIEKIEANSNVVFAVVLYTECDVGRDKTMPESANQKRARQNVVFEHGYLIGKLGRNHVCALVKGEVETPGDISGVVYTPMDDKKAWEIRLYKNMKAAGIDVDMNKII